MVTFRFFIPSLLLFYLNNFFNINIYDKKFIKNLNAYAYLIILLRKNLLNNKILVSYIM